MRSKEAGAPCLFGRVRLGYVLVESGRLDAWSRFGKEGLGLHVDRPEPGVLAMRVDDHERRIVVRQGPTEDVVALGWEFDDEEALQSAVARLRDGKLTVKEETGEAASLRGVDRLWSFDGPKHLGFEFFTAPRRTDRPLEMAVSGFVTGASGLGHVAITSRRPEALQAFLEESLDARVSDHIEDRLNGVEMDFTFLRLNERHHSVAIAATRVKRMDPIRTRIHHLNLQAKSLEDVTCAYRRMRQMGFAIANGIGQHPNDREMSFYVASPSGFEVELGWNPIVVDDEARWSPVKYRGISLWGHFPESLTLASKLAQMGRAITSLTRKEYTVGREP